MYKHKPLYPIFLLAAITTLGYGNSAYGCPACEANAAIKHAAAARLKASSVGGEWINTESLVQAAKDANQKGDFATAKQLAQEARHQGDLGYKQVMMQPGNLEFPAYLQ